MIHCVIIDDEPLALIQLGGYIKQIPFLKLEKSCQNTFEALECLREKKIDLIFTDISMPDQNGMDFIRSLPDPPLVIFTTAYSSYAVEGFKLNAVDYLLKPFEFQDCLKAAEKARHLLELISSAPTENTLFVKSDYKVVRIELDSITYIESMSEYICIHTEEREKPIITLHSLQKLEGRLPDHFMRVHRSYIVNLKKIKEISRFRIRIDQKKLIPISENYKERFMEYINRNCLL